MSREGSGLSCNVRRFIKLFLIVKCVIKNVVFLGVMRGFILNRVMSNRECRGLSWRNARIYS